MHDFNLDEFPHGRHFDDYIYARLQRLPERELIEFPPGCLPAHFQPAAVLLCCWPTADHRVEVVLTRRSTSLSSHQGQVSFPGGRVDDQDPSFAAAALREAWEELAIDPAHVAIMGRLDDAWSRHGHHVIPYVGWMDTRPVMQANPAEVDEVLIADLQTLMLPGSERRHEVPGDGKAGQTHVTRAFAWQGGYVWGLTADLLYELILWLRGQPSNRGRQRLQRIREFSVR